MELDGDNNQLLVDEWKWVETTRLRSGTTTYLTPDSENTNVEMNIRSNGRFQVDKDGNCQRKHRIIEIDESIGTESITFGVKLNRKRDFNGVSLFLYQSEDADTVVSNNAFEFFGFSFEDDGSDYKHYFVRKE